MTTAEAPAPAPAGHARCIDADHHHCPRCGGALAAFAYCAGCGLSVDFRMYAAPAPDMAALLARRDEIGQRASTGQMIAFMERCVSLGIPTRGRARQAVAAYIIGAPGPDSFKEYTREQAWTVLSWMSALDRYLEENPRGE